MPAGKNVGNTTIIFLVTIKLPVLMFLFEGHFTDAQWGSEAKLSSHNTPISCGKYPFTEN